MGEKKGGLMWVKGELTSTCVLICIYGLIIITSNLPSVCMPPDSSHPLEHITTA